MHGFYEQKQFRALPTWITPWPHILMILLPTQYVFLTLDLRQQNSIAPLDMTWSPRNKWSPVVSPTTMATVRCLDLTTMMMTMLIHPKIPKRWRVRKQTSTWWMQVQRPHHLEPHELWKCLGKQEDIGFELLSEVLVFFGKGNRFNTNASLKKGYAVRDQEWHQYADLTQVLCECPVSQAPKILGAWSPLGKQGFSIHLFTMYPILYTH